MSHGHLVDGPATIAAPRSLNPFVRGLEMVLLVLNRIIIVGSQIALVAASLVLCWSVAARYFFKMPTYWQDEAAVLLLAGATFLSSAYVQSHRGHIGIEALTGLLSPSVNRVRLLLIDIASGIFCGFFAWKSWVLVHEAQLDGQVSSSTWAFPLTIPYTIMAIGMSLLTFQIVVQILIALTGKRPDHKYTADKQA